MKISPPRLQALFLTVFLLLAAATASRAQCSLVSITGPNGTDPVTLCDGGVIPDKLCFKASSYASRIRFVITDENDNLIADFNKQCVDFDIFPSGLSRVYAISFAYYFTGQPGDNIFTDTIAGYCQVVSENFIEVVNAPAGGSEAGEVSLQGGATETAICTGDGQGDTLFFENTAVLNGATFRYVVTDENDEVLALLDGNSADFDDGQLGVERIYGLVYQGGIPIAVGDTLNPQNLGSCSDLSDNFVEVTKAEAAGGILLTADGQSNLDLCPGDGLPDVVEFAATGASPVDYIFLVTDGSGEVIDILTDPLVDFDDYGPGSYVVWGLSYTGNLTVQIGSIVNLIDLSDGCYDLSEPVVVVSEDPEGGTVSLPGEVTEALVCPGNGVPDLLEFEKLTTSGAAYAFVLTDEQNQIVEVLDGITAYDFEGQGEGISRVYGVSYVGNLTAMPGMDVLSADLAEPCFDLSDNFITVTREIPVGGSVQLQGGGQSVAVCSGDGLPDPIEFEAVGNTTSQYRFVLTDGFGNIISLLNTDSIDLDGTLGGDEEWRIYGAAYTGDFLLFLGDNINNPVSNDCYDLSENFISISLNRVDGGVVFIPGNPVAFEAFICPGDADPDVIQFDSSNLGNVDYAFLITDTNNVVLDVTPEDSYDFNDSDEGTCRVWGLSYQGDLLAVPGDTAGVAVLASDCWSLSQNFITIVKDAPDGGALSTDDGADSYDFCSGDGVADVISLSNNSTSTAVYTYLLTDADNIFIEELSGPEVDLEGRPAGDYRIWGLSYTGNFTLSPGEDAATTPPSDDCAGLSVNFISASLTFVEGGTLSAQQGATQLFACLGDGEPDFVGVISNSTADDASYDFLITDNNGALISVAVGTLIDFENLTPATYRIYGLSYTGNLLLQTDDIVTDAPLAEGCASLSNNFIEVIAEVVDAGTVSDPEGNVVVYTCPGDGNPDEVFFQNNGSGTAAYRYVVTDQNNIIKQVVEESADFEVLGQGVSRVYGLSYSGNLSGGLLNQNALQAAYSDGCFVLSDNFVEVIRSTPDGGQISTNDGSGFAEVCADDGTPDSLKFETTSMSNAPYTYLVTNDENVVLEVYDGNVIDFETFSPGEYLVRGLSYTGNITVQPGDTLGTVPLTDDCFDLSGDAVTVFVFDVGGPCNGFTSMRSAESAAVEGRALSLFPNPALEQLQLNWLQMQAGSVEILLYDLTGRVLKSIPLKVEKGHAQQRLNVSFLKPGLYVVELRTGEEREALRFIKR